MSYLKDCRELRRALDSGKQVLVNHISGDLDLVVKITSGEHDSQYFDCAGCRDIHADVIHPDGTPDNYYIGHDYMEWKVVG